MQNEERQITFNDIPEVLSEIRKRIRDAALSIFFYLFTFAA